MNLTIHPFKTADSLYHTYTLSAPSGMQVSISSYGAAITEILLPDRQGYLQNVVLSVRDPCQYLSNPLYAGAILAPVAGRISHGRFTLNGHPYTLSQNDGSHHIHGGLCCASFQNFTYLSSQETAHQISLSLRIQLSDGLDGYPGNRQITAEYTLEDSGSLHILYTGTSDTETYFNLSNHSYFNLSGNFSKDCYRHILQIPANTYIANNKEHLPMGLFPVEDTPFDYRQPTSILAQMSRYPDNKQLKNALGYNNGFVLSGAHTGTHADSVSDSAASPDSDSSPALVLFDQTSGRRLSLYTNAPCIVLYSGGYITGRFTLKDQTPACPGCALALEPQELPDAPNHPEFDAVSTHADECYTRHIRYCFDIVC